MDQTSTKTLLMQKVIISLIKFVLNFVKSESSLGRIDETHFRSDKYEVGEKTE